jgi:hypothetical protein
MVLAVALNLPQDERRSVNIATVFNRHLPAK